MRESEQLIVTLFSKAQAFKCIPLHNGRNKSERQEAWSETQLCWSWCLHYQMVCLSTPMETEAQTEQVGKMGIRGFPSGPPLGLRDFFI